MVGTIGRFRIEGVVSCLLYDNDQQIVSQLVPAEECSSVAKIISSGGVGVSRHLRDCEYVRKQLLNAWRVFIIGFLGVGVFITTALRVIGRLYTFSLPSNVIWCNCSGL